MLVTSATRNLLRVAGAAPALRSSATPLLIHAQRRFVQTQHLTTKDNLALLNEQRLKRPNSPHLTIYQPQLTWYLSGLNRITGSALSGLLYVSAMAYLLHPVFPAIDSAHVISFVHDLPVWLKTSGKFIISLPFFFHSFNGIRHLLWDTGKALSLKGVYSTGYAVLGATAISSVVAAFFL
ncbi:cytochrome b subunit of succinate dehydrogenase, Sdh3p [Naganishia albida]|nr:cytochrome b subunit of succinate dehydrogenase, Sdh3p [Naganishia albida]